MNGLYPIIRRVRRPLIPVERAADAKPVNVPVTVVADAVASVEPAAVVAAAMPASAVEAVRPAVAVPEPAHSERKVAKANHGKRAQQ